MGIETEIAAGVDALACGTKAMTAADVDSW